MLIRCPACQAWECTERQYADSFVSDSLQAWYAVSIFQTFVERFPKIATAREHMVLIDRLIHEFHYAISRLPDGSLGRNNLPHETTANNLIEDGHQQVVEFLNTLTYGVAGTPEVQATYEAWRSKAEQMQLRRRRGHQ
jgi:hypothetical protein